MAFEMQWTSWSSCKTILHVHCSPLNKLHERPLCCCKGQIKLENRLSKAALIFLQVEIFLVCSSVVVQLRIRVIGLEVFLSEAQEHTIKSAWKVKFPAIVINIPRADGVVPLILWNKLVYQKLLYAKMSVSLSLRTKPTRICQSLKVLNAQFPWTGWSEVTPCLQLDRTWQKEFFPINHLCGCSLEVVPGWSAQGFSVLF